MAHPIPVSATVSPGHAPLDALALDLFLVTQDGRIEKEVGRFPVLGGVAQVESMTLPDPRLRWALRVTDLAAAVPVYRSGPLLALPGGPRRFPVGDRIRVHRGGGALALDAGDGAPQALIDHLREGLGPRWTLRGVDLGADPEGRYVVTLHARFAPLPFATIELTYRRAFRIAPSLDPGRSRRVAVAWPQGPAQPPSLPVPGLMDELDGVMAGGVEAQMTAMGTHIGWLMLAASGITDLVPQTVSLTSLDVRDGVTEVDARISLCAGALAGGIRVFDPAAAVVEPVG